MASIRDVAKLAQVAPSTVSLVLNNKGYVSDQARKKVLAAMEKLDYTPNELARNLFRNRTNIIGVIVPDIAHPFFGEFIRALELSLYKHNYTIMVCSTIERQNAEHELVDMLKRQMIDGIIMGCHSLEIDLYNNINKPIVALDRFINKNIPIIRSDHELGGKLAAKAILEANCKHPIQIIGAQKVKTPAHLHHLSFKEELAKYDIHVTDFEMEWNRFDMKYFQKIAKDIFTHYPEMDSIYGSDMVICACYGEATRRGISIPQELKLIAYDGTLITNCGLCNITSIVQNIEELAQNAGEMMVKLINKQEVNKEIIIPVAFRLGTTC